VRRWVVLACAVTSLARFAAAQSLRAADSLLQRGSLERAESLYYAAASARPRDPTARWALGRYIAARGHPRVAIPLLEEAVRFGGDAALINADLAPLYLAIGDYHALAALTPSPLSSGERERAAWLDAHPSRVIAPDSVIAAAYRAADASVEGVVGRIAIRINGKIVDAGIDPSARGIVLSDSTAGTAHVRLFVERNAAGRGRSSYSGVADSIGISRLSLTNVPVRTGSIKGAAVVGLDVLARFAPTFDPSGGRITLRTTGTLDRAPAGGTSFSTLVQGAEWRVLRAGGWLFFHDEEIAHLLRDRRWTLDAKQGDLIIEGR